MEKLNQAILNDGVALEPDIVRVDSFLNHRIDVKLAGEMGREIHRHFAGKEIDCVLTIEASGIPIAVTTAQAFGEVPVVYAKKGNPLTMDEDAFMAQVYSFTRRTENTIRVSRRFLHEGMRLLLVDDFLANGGAIEGLMSIARQARCEVVGAAVCVEKGFQPGGRNLRAQGLDLYSLAIVDSIEDGKVVLRGE